MENHQIEKVLDKHAKKHMLQWSLSGFKRSYPKLLKVILETVREISGNKKERQRLWKVTLKGMTHNSTGVAHGINYVIAPDSDSAYQKVKHFLDTNDIGFTRERELDKVELIADSDRYNEVGFMILV